MNLRVPCDLSLLGAPSDRFSKQRCSSNRSRTRAELHVSSPPAVPTHRVTVHDRKRGLVHEFIVPEDQYILHTAESQDISLPFSCRHGCCTSCAVRIKSGEIRQPEALGISAELKSKGVRGDDVSTKVCIGVELGADEAFHAVRVRVLHIWL